MTDQSEEIADKDREISRLKNRLARCREELEDFAYVVSHDLRAPLRGIISLADWLKDDYKEILDQQGLEYLDKLMERTRRMNGMLESILQFSRLGRNLPHLELFDSNNAVKAIITSLSPPENIPVSISGQLPEIRFDKNHFTIIMENLLKNAIQHLGKPKASVTVSCQSVPGPFWEFCVADTGVGIESKHFDVIFKMFRTILPVGDGDVKGVGLTLVKRILRHNGGDIRVESEPGEGCRFFFTIPGEQGE